MANATVSEVERLRKEAQLLAFATAMVLVLPFVEPPGLDDGQPEEIQLVEHQPGSLYRPRQPAKKMRQVERQSARERERAREREKETQREREREREGRSALGERNGVRARQRCVLARHIDVRSISCPAALRWLQSDTVHLYAQQ